MFRILGWLLLVVLIAVGVWAYFFAQAAGLFLDLKPVPLACRAVTGGGIVGVEDLTIDPETKLGSKIASSFLNTYIDWHQELARSFSQNKSKAFPNLAVIFFRTHLF